MLTCRLHTPSGAGAIAVVRVFGPGAWEAVAHLVRTGRGALPAEVDPGRLIRGSIQDGREVLDDVLVVRLPGLAVETVDISCHGGIRVGERILLALTSAGVALDASDAPALLLPAPTHSVAAEAESALQRARTARGVNFVLTQARLLPEELERCAMLVRAGAAAQARAHIKQLLSCAAGAVRLVESATVSLVGLVNAGKSALANRLAGREGAIVSARSGTTRDWVTIDAALQGVPLRLLDTAGDRSEADALEQLAVQRGWAEAGRSDLALLVLDASMIGVSAEAERWVSMFTRVDRLVVLNKIDLTGGVLPAACLGRVDGCLAVSAQTGQGLADLEDAILGRLGISPDLDRSPAVFSSSLQDRLRDLLQTTAGDDERFACGIELLAAGVSVG